MVIGPNSLNDNPSPWNLITDFVNSTILRGNFSKNLPSWFNTTSIPYKVFFLLIKLYKVMRPKLA